MTAQRTSSAIVAVASLREFFHQSMQRALRQQRVQLDAHTEHYVVNVLTMFSRSEALFDHTPEGLRLKPLALMLADAMDAPSERQRHDLLRRLGDVALFIAGFFSESFARRLVDVDYHIALGGRAYGTLAQQPASRSFAAVYAELAGKFQPLVDVLNEVAQMGHRHTDADVLRLYELWLKTGSARSHAILARLGVVPTQAARDGVDQLH